MVGTGEKFPLNSNYLSKNCIKINLRHGYGPRSNGISFKIKNNKIIKIDDQGKSYNSKLSKWDYINYTNKNISNILGTKFGIPKKKSYSWFSRCYRNSTIRKKSGEVL